MYSLQASQSKHASQTIPSKRGCGSVRRLDPLIRRGSDQPILDKATARLTGVACPDPAIDSRAWAVREADTGEVSSLPFSVPRACGSLEAMERYRVTTRHACGHGLGAARTPAIRLGGLVFLVASLLVGEPAWGRSSPGLEERVRLVREQMSIRGAAPGEVHLALASIYAQAGHKDGVYQQIDLGRRHGISVVRLDLVLATYFRRAGRFDAAFSTLVRVLVEHEDQPHALVELWKTLYQCLLQGAQVKSDLDAIRERLVEAGLHFPKKLRLEADAAEDSRKTAAAGNNALLADNNRFAAELFEAAIEGDPSNAQAHRGLGIARARLGMYAQAAGAYLIYMDLAPMAPDADIVDRLLMDYWKSKQK